MGEFRSRLYCGQVMHHRFSPKPHRFIYRVFSLCVDVDELPALQQKLRLFSHNRRNLFALYDCDYGNGRPGELRSFVEGLLRRQGLEQYSQRIELLCYPRILGYVFNPLSVYFCYGDDARPGAIIYEVSNTFGERHNYVLATDSTQQAADQPLRQGCDKSIYVSPFIGMDCKYRFRICPPAERVAVAIRQSEQDAPLLHASFSGQRQPLDDRQLRRLFFSYPLMTLKVIGAIHWEALRLWLKGVPLRARPSPRSATSGEIHDETR